MTKLPKFFLMISIASFSLGIVVCFTSIRAHPSWMVAMPAGAIFFGLFLNAYILQKETAEFDREEARNRSLAIANKSASSNKTYEAARVGGNVKATPALQHAH